MHSSPSPPTQTLVPSSPPLSPDSFGRTETPDSFRGGATPSVTRDLLINFQWELTGIYSGLTGPMHNFSGG